MALSRSRHLKNDINSLFSILIRYGRNRQSALLFNILLFSPLFSLVFLGCGPKSTSNDESSVQIVEVDYCQSRTGLSGLTISGLATFEQLPSTAYGLGNKLSKKIRYAEVWVMDSAGQIVQCGETDGFGNYILQMQAPTASTTYTIQVNSRANNGFVKASILNDFHEKKFYSVATQVQITTGETSVVAPTLVAPATGSLEGGAFNILEQITLTNDYLRSHSTETHCSSCRAFTVAPKVNVYWKKGFTPGAYTGHASSSVSFFDWSGGVSQPPSLYILGGNSGDVDNTDTDHYDNSVVIHEYGHFLEHTYSKSDSQGGSHNGNSIIDPRLAWSEGFSNYLPAIVTNSRYYVDTTGSPYGNTYAKIVIDFETPDLYDQINNKTILGEGIYREVSVSRALYDYTDISTDLVLNPSGSPLKVQENSQLNFAYIWSALTHSDFGLSNNDLHFRSMGHFNQSLKSILIDSFGSSSAEVNDFEVAMKGEYQVADTSQYAQPLKNLSSTSCVNSMTPQKDSSTTVGGVNMSMPDLFSSSDFYSYFHPGGNLQLALLYLTDISNPSDLDVYIYREDYILRDETTLAGVSNSYRVNEKPTGSETISLFNLPTGYYLIVVKAFTSTTTVGGTATYSLKVGEQFLCQ